MVMRGDVGGGFLLPSSDDAELLFPERFTDEQRAMRETALAFSHREVLPVADRIDRKEPGLLPALLARAGGLGLLAVDVPEELGGLGLGKVEALLVKEGLVLDGSFGVTSGAHTTIGMLPLLTYGTTAQKQRWLPALCRGERICAYALTEAGSGSDALSGRTTATRDGDHYVLRGVKQWITNAGFADLFTVFARVDGQAFSAFMVERTDPGVRVGAEEKKLGIRGSSTCELILEDVRIPADRMLGQEGRGHRMALGILNMGRLKLGAGAVGSARYALSIAAKFANERQQFGRNIGRFGLVRQKLARMAARIHGMEAVTYRVAGQVDARTASGARPEDALEEFAAECSAVKVLCSEGLALVTDEGVQVLGGYGFTEHFGMERLYRDARIHRIFEGTNEINRLVVVSTLFKRARRGAIPLLDAEATRGPGEDVVRQPETRRAEVHRSLACRLLQRADHVLGAELDERQDVAGPLADVLVNALLSDSAARRAAHAGGALQHALARITVHEAHEALGSAMRLLVPLLWPGADAAAAHAELCANWDTGPVDVAEAVETVAASVLEEPINRT